MMNSSLDDEFAPNPFRSQQQQQQQQSQQLSPAWLSTSPDPNSGMVGSMDMPSTPPDPYSGLSSGQQPPPPPMQQQHDPTQWSGSMDQRAAAVESYGSNASRGINPNDGSSGGGSIMSRFGWRACVSCFQLNSYVQYFDLETKDVVDRLKASVLKFWMPDQFRTAVVGDARPDAQAQTDPMANTSLKGPDLYGPVWISFTLIFCIAVTSNIHAYWSHKRLNSNNDDPNADVEEFEVDIRRLLHASSVVLTFVFVVSSCFWMGTTCMGMPGISWAMWVCCYGYSQVVYIPAAILIAILPFEIISWCALAAATGASALLVLRNLSTPLMAQDSASHAKAAPFILAILGCHSVYLLVVKIWFFP